MLRHVVLLKFKAGVKETEIARWKEGSGPFLIASKKSGL